MRRGRAVIRIHKFFSHPPRTTCHDDYSRYSQEVPGRGPSQESRLSARMGLRRVEMIGQRARRRFRGGPRLFSALITTLMRTA